MDDDKHDKYRVKTLLVSENYVQWSISVSTVLAGKGLDDHIDTPHKVITIGDLTNI